MLAHASGFNWDEGLMVLAPIVCVCGLLGWARRREAHTAAVHSSLKKPQ